MSKLQPTDKALSLRVKANIKRHMDAIKQAIVSQAKAKGRHITKSGIKRVSFKSLRDVEYELFDIHFDKFVITDPENLVWLDGMTWTNNSSVEAQRQLRVEASTQDAYHWQITSGFTYAYSTSKAFEIYAPAGGYVSNTLNFNFDFHAAHGQAKSSRHQWSDVFDQIIPAESAVRMEVRAVQFVGYLPFTITARLSGKADCECVIDFLGKHTESFSLDLSRILDASERTFKSQGRVDGVQGYSWRVDSFTPQALAKLSASPMPEGVTEQRILPEVLELTVLEAAQA